MTDHVGVGEVEDNQVVFAGIDGCDRLVGQLGRRHLGLQVIGGDLGRRHHDTVLALVRLLAAAVQKVSDVRIFLGLGHAQLRAAGRRYRFAEDVGEALLREDRVHQFFKLVGVLRHADGIGEADESLALEAGKFLVEHRAQYFAHAVGAEVEAQQASPSFMP